MIRFFVVETVVDDDTVDTGVVVGTDVVVDKCVVVGTDVVVVSVSPKLEKRSEVKSF